MIIQSKYWQFLKDDIKKNLPSFVSTFGYFERTFKYQIRDLDWNHMDALHRPNIHDTFHESIRIASNKNYQFSYTRIGKLPFVVPVYDVRIGEGEFYQTYSLFNLFTIISYTKIDKINNLQVKQNIEWLIASPKYLKFLHKFISRKIYKMNKLQTEEDIVIRERRFKLRKAGFSFGTDNPNYLNSNDLTSKIIPPKNNSLIDLKIDFNDLSKIEIKKFKIECITLYIRRDKDNILIWPGICPHEGAELTRDCFVNDLISCPWHNLNFKPQKLSKIKPSIKILGLNIKLLRNAIKISN